MEEDELIPPAELAQLASALACAICKDVLDGPVSAPCGHIFCSGCIRGYLDHTQKQNQSQMCPSCRRPCAPNDLRRLDAVRMAVEALLAAIAAVHELKSRCEDAERRAAAAEQQVAQLLAARAHSTVTTNNTHTAAAAAINAAVAASIPTTSLLLEISERSLGTGASGRRGAGDGNDVGGDGAVEDWQAGVTPGPPPQSRLAGSRAGKRTRRDADAVSGDRVSQRATPPPGLRVGGAADDGNMRVGPWAGDDDTEAGGYDGDDGDDEGDRDYSPGSPSGSDDRASGRAGRRRRGQQQQQHPRGGGGGGRQGAGQRAKRARLGDKSPHTTTTITTASDVPDGQASTGDAAAAAAAAGPSRARHEGRTRAALAGSGVTPAPAAELDAPPGAVPDGLGECPLCSCRYPLLQLQAHVEMCLTRKGMVGAGRAPGALGRAPVAAAAAAAAAGTPDPAPLPQGRRGQATSAVGPGSEARPAGAAAAAVAATAAQPHLRLGTARLGSGPPEVREPTDIRVPAARNWHQMKDKEARKVMADCGLPTFGQKQEMAERYNRYRSFLQTERDKCTTQTMDQLLRAFIKRERQADAGRRQPAVAPAWMQAQIKSAAEQMKAQQQQQQHRRAPRRPPDLDSAEADHNNPAAAPDLGQPQAGVADPAAASEQGPEDGYAPVGAAPGSGAPSLPPDQRTAAAAVAGDAAATPAAATAAGDAPDAAAAAEQLGAFPGAGAGPAPVPGAIGEVARGSGGGPGIAAGAGAAAAAARPLPPSADVITIDDSDDGEDPVRAEAEAAARHQAEGTGVDMSGLGMAGAGCTVGATGRRLVDGSSPLQTASLPPAARVGNVPPAAPPGEGAAGGSDTGGRRWVPEERGPGLRTPGGVCPGGQRGQRARLAGDGVGAGGGGVVSGSGSPSGVEPMAVDGVDGDSGGGGGGVASADGVAAGFGLGEMLRSDSGESSDEEAVAAGGVTGAGCSGPNTSAFHGVGVGVGGGGGAGAEAGALGGVPLVQCLAEAAACELPYTANGLRTTPRQLGSSALKVQQGPGAVTPAGYGFGSGSGVDRGLGSGSGPRTGAPSVQRSNPDSGGGGGSVVRGGGMLRAQPPTVAAGAAAESLTDISNGNGAAGPRPSPLTTPTVKASLFL